MAAPLTEECIRKLRDLIISGVLPPGGRIPAENELAAMLGSSRNTAREAVRALVTARVLDVRRGDGTYVTTLRPELLLEGIALAVDLMQAGSLLEIFEVRRLLEPPATALAAERAGPATLRALRTCLEQMRRSVHDHEALGMHDAYFHDIVVRATGNVTLATMLSGISSGTVRARVWRGIIENGSASLTIAQHEQILTAIEAADPGMAHAAALLHLGTTESWVRRLEQGEQRRLQGGGSIARPAGRVLQ